MNSLFKKNLILYYFLKTRLRQFTNREALLARQQAALLHFQKKILMKSPFYRPYAYSNFTDIPIISKSLHMQHFESINTRNIKLEQAMAIAATAEQNRNFSQKIQDISVGLSSGTSGNRGIFLSSEWEQAIWAGTILGKMLPTKMEKHRIALFLRANNNLYQTINNKFMQFKFFDLLLPWENLLAQCQQYQPTLLIAPATVLTLLAQEQSKNLQLNPTKIISIAEVLLEHDKAYIEHKFQQPVHQIYQCTEGFLAHTCNKNTLHLNEDIVYVEKEWLDRKTGRFTPIVTDFMRVTQPIVRYKLDDILITSDDPCTCGSSLRTLKKIEGRCDDILYLPQENKLIKIFPDFIIRAMLNASQTICFFQVRQVSLQQLIISLDANDTSMQQLVMHHLNTLWREYKVKTPNYQFQTISTSNLSTKQRRVIRSFKIEEM